MIPNHLKVSPAELGNLLFKSSQLVKTTDQRFGQAFFNTLHQYHTELAELIRASELDPFYRDDRLPQLYNELVHNGEVTELISVLTHNGTMHADEVMACAVLFAVLPADRPVTLTRKRLPASELDRYSYVIDTGGLYDGVKFFDHHQSTFNRKHPNGVSMSSLGLIWEKFGLDYIRRALAGNNQLGEADIQTIYSQLLPTIQWLDAHDNGELKNGPCKTTVDAAVNLDTIQLTHVITLLNPQAIFETADEVEMLSRFNYAVDLAQRILKALVYRKAGRLVAGKLVNELDHGGPILVLPYYVEWNTPVSDRPHIKFVIHPGMDNTNFVVNVAKNGSGYGSMENLRHPFPLPWAGLQSEQLVEATGVSSALFCHKGRHLATAASASGALELARKALATCKSK